jgi:hypothetical protein
MRAGVLRSHVDQHFLRLHVDLLITYRAGRQAVTDGLDIGISGGSHDESSAPVILGGAAVIYHITQDATL